jgi:NAD(P)-dependent dehydrogenase (short-subunit alcohol dehydrogenase family)
MKEFKDKVAVVTGAASGIGRGMANRFAAEGMKVVLADIEEEALAETAAELRSKGASVLAVRTDVSKATDVEALAGKTVDAFGAVHVLCNNAGVAVPGVSWELTVADWEWVLGVNLWGVIHGIRVFVPIMLAQDEEGHIVNTSSTAGLLSSPGIPIYNVTKHGVVTLSEILLQELSMSGAKVKASVLCPLYVDTRIADSDRNRPADLQNVTPAATGGPEGEGAVHPISQLLASGGEQAFRQLLATGLSPDEMADQVFNAIKDEKFYILSDPRIKDGVRSRMEGILEERNPTFDLLGIRAELEASKGGGAGV